jgi:hypothetical protein
MNVARRSHTATLLPNAVGTSGVSEVYGENDLGGVSVSIRLGVTF